MQEKVSIFKSLPVSLFGSVMGLSGLSVAYGHLSAMHPAFAPLQMAVDGFTLLVFVLLGGIYLGKWIFYPAQAKGEFTNPLTKSFFGTITISLLLLPQVIHKYAPTMAFYLWVLGVTGTFLFALYMVYFWVETKHAPQQLTPAWIIPVVGTLDVPLASHLFTGSYIPFVNFSALAIGLFFAVPLLTLIFSRVIFIEKLPHKLMPTLMILIAPFSVGHLAYMATFGHLDAMAFGLFILGIFLFLSLLPQLFRITQVCPFKVSWWAISFPLAGVINSLYSVGHTFGYLWIAELSNILSLGFSLIVLYLIYRTAKGMIKQDFTPFS